ncbi:MFS transporter [Hahella sp. KA22]|uniref:MFS transporter n=1 Tax=Hahella sp. KA22 TaxID=1628392 RepID=UPI000FDF51E3|nr:MFS transporter [Hahella sp. KA22]AZZ91519.1 MFS transporter [Hahella sp. KA22]QAY54888.1 MFS transporter [Hahella sp. KA22]
MANKGVFNLLGSIRFLPYFLTQAFGAFNDNLFKQGILLLFAYRLSEEESATLVNVAAGLFILPFFLFSPLAGQLADKFEKGKLIRVIKLVEIALMSLAAFAFISESKVLLLFLLFMMGVQSAAFGPVKYSILPQHLKHEELLAGNALVEMGTFLAILFGTILAGVLFSHQGGVNLIAGGIIVCAIAGYVASRSIPQADSVNPQLRINWNPITETMGTVRDVKDNRAVFLSVMAISWFWFLGASYLTQFNLFTKEYLLGNPAVATGLLTLFSIGVATGSLLCSKLSDGKVELGLVPIGSLGLTLFGAHLYFATPDVNVIELRTFGEFLADPSGYGVLLDLLFIGLFGGFYIVPLYALIQERSEEKKRAQVIALNNVMNAIFMVFSAAFAIVFLTLIGLTIPEYFLVLAIMNAVVAVYIFKQVPEFALRFCIWLLGHTMYRVTHRGLSNIPQEGPVVLVCNHVSYVDAMLIGGAVRRPVRFVMDKGIYEMPGLHWFFKLARTIPITSEKRDQDTYHRAFEAISEALENGEVICIFPEGRLTKTGDIDAFRKGIELIIQRNPVPVTPMALRGLWGSFFSHKDGMALAKLPRRFWSKVELVADASWEPEKVSSEALEEKVKALRGEWA